MSGTFIIGLKDLMASGENLPTLPHVVLQVHRALDDEMASSGQIAEIIEKDPALTTRLLRMANSAYFGGGRSRVGGVTDAINRMGMGQVRATCLVLAVVESFTVGEGLDHNRFWAHSAYAGMAAQRLWRLAGRPAFGEQYANVYVAGLLHDIGLLVMDQFFPEEFTGNLEDSAATGRELWIVEEERLGLDHGEIGGLLLGRWMVPPMVAEAVARHHRPESASEDARDVCRFVHASEVLATLGNLSGGVEGVPRTAAEDVLANLGFPPLEIPEVLEDLEALEAEAAGFAGMARTGG